MYFLKAQTEVNSLNPNFPRLVHTNDTLNVGCKLCKVAGMFLQTARRSFVETITCIVQRSKSTASKSGENIESTLSDNDYHSQ